MGKIGLFCGLAFTLVTGIFGLLLGYKYSGGSYHIYWPEGFGAAIMPAVLAILVAGGIKFAWRDSSFPTTWLIVFLATSAFFMMATYTSVTHNPTG